MKIDISRGDMTPSGEYAHASQDIEVMLWLVSSQALDPNGVIPAPPTRDCKAKIKAVRYKIDINTLHKNTRTQLA